MALMIVVECCPAMERGKKHFCLVQESTRHLTQRMSRHRLLNRTGGRLTASPRAWNTVPIFLGILQTFPRGHPLPALALDRLEQKGSQIGHRWLDQVVLNCEEVGSRRLTQQLLNDLLGLVNLRGQKIDSILCIQVEVSSVISQSLHVSVASRHVVALGIWRSHICRILADHIGDGSFVLDHLLLPQVGRDACQAVMRPGMGGNLVTFIDHPPQQVGPRGRGIDCTFPQIVSRDKERCREAILLEEIQQFGSVNIWTIIIRQGHDIRLGAAVDVLIISDLPQARPWIGEGGSSRRRFIRITTPKLPLAVRIPAIVVFRATVSLNTADCSARVCPSPAGFGISGRSQEGRGNLPPDYSIDPLDILSRQRHCHIWPFPPGKYIARIGFDIRYHNSPRWNRKTFVPNSQKKRLGLPTPIFRPKREEGRLTR